MRRIAVPPRIRQISRSYFLKQNLEISLALLISLVCCFYHFWWSNVPVNKNKLRMCLHLIEFVHGTVKLSFFGWYMYVRSLKTFPPDWAMMEIVFTIPLTIYNSLEPINSALFSKAKPLRSPRLVKLNSFNFDRKPCHTLCITSTDHV